MVFDVSFGVDGEVEVIKYRLCKWEVIVCVWEFIFFVV